MELLYCPGGGQTLDVLREMFGPAGFKSLSSGGGWRRGLEPHMAREVHLPKKGLTQFPEKDPGHSMIGEGPQAKRKHSTQDHRSTPKGPLRTSGAQDRALRQDNQTPLQSGLVAAQCQGPIGQWDPPAVQASFDGSLDRTILISTAIYILPSGPW